MRFSAFNRDLAVEVAVTAGIVALAWWYSASNTSYAVVALPDMLSTFADTWFFDNFSSDVLPSLKRLALGYTTAVVIGAAGGFVLGLFATVRLIFHPLLSFIRSIPPVTLVPPALFIIGLGDQLQITIIALVCIWPVLLNVADGVAEVDDTLLSTARSYGITGLERFRFVTFPAVSPRLAAGMRTSLSFAVLVLVTSEMVASTNGVGTFVFNAQQQYAVANMWAGIILLGLLGVVLNLIFGFAERRLLRWHLGLARGST